MLLVVLVFVLTAAGVVGVNYTQWGRQFPPGRRMLYGAIGGAGTGLLVLPLLGLVAAILFFLVCLAAIVAIIFAVIALARHLNRSRY